LGVAQVKWYSHFSALPILLLPSLPLPITITAAMTLLTTNMLNTNMLTTNILTTDTTTNHYCQQQERTMTEKGWRWCTQTPAHISAKSS
jgi:hypothetical protein